MAVKSFAELTKHVHLLNDLILSDMICGSLDYSEEFLTFSRHLFATKYWFVRISWANKRRYILALMEDIRSAWALSLLLKSLWNCRPKDAVLSANQHRPWSVYDQAPLDHNRTALPITILAQVMSNDRKWFHLLEPESQALVLCELLTIAGGPVMWEVLHRGQMIYEHHREQMLRSLLDCIVVDPNPPLGKPMQQEHQEPKSPTAKAASQPQSEANDIMTMPSDPILYASTSSLYDTILPPTPVAADVEKAQRNLEASLNAWNQIIKGIRESQKLDELEMTFNDGSKRTIWKVNRPRPDTIETVDFIQLLPSSIAKQIFLYLPRANFPEYAKVNKYWAYLIDEVKIEFATRIKLDADKQKLEEMMIKHDVSLEVFHPSGLVTIAGSIAYSVEPSSRRGVPSYRASERSAGGVSFRHMVVDKLKPKHVIKPKPIRKMADLTERLERRGAADENLWQWCENAHTIWKGKHPKTSKWDEGVLRCGYMHFPCPLMKYSVELPMKTPLAHDPAQPTAGLPKAKKNFSYAPVNEPKEKDLKRFSLWSRDFSSLYKVFKVASYQYPV